MGATHIPTGGTLARERDRDFGVMDLTTGKRMVRRAAGRELATGDYTFRDGVYTFAATDVGHIVQLPEPSELIREAMAHWNA